MVNGEKIKVLLADDDDDDRFFFAKALTELSATASLVSVEDGSELMKHLSEKASNSPDVLFLDINMPRKNGLECLVEIKSNNDIKNFPVVMYSTSLEDRMADLLYQNGAHYYLRKGDFPDLLKYLQLILTKIKRKDFKRPSRAQFVMNLMEV